MVRADRFKRGGWLMLELVFWALSTLVLYVYAGYPLLLWALRAVAGRKPVRSDASEPSVTLVISAYNEEASIGDKIENSLRLDYPSNQFEVLVVSDASSDHTDEVVSSFESDRVRLLRMVERGGKTLGLNRAVREARGEIIVFSDANALYYPDALRTLVRNFADPDVGAAVGESTYVDTETEAERSEGLYWRYEVAIKRLESDLGSVVGGDGAIYAVRRELYRDLRADALSDFVNPLQVVEQGRRVVYEPAAKSYERAGDDFGKEFRRKVRIVNRAWRATWSLRQMLNPWRHGLFAVELISHKLLRWLVPVMLTGLLMTNLLLARDGGIYALTLAAQMIFYSLAFIGWRFQHRESLPSLLSVPYFFCLVNVASAQGIMDAFRGKTYTTWTTARAGQP